MNRRITLIIMLHLLLYQDQTSARLRLIIDRMDALEVSKESKMQVIALHISPNNNSLVQAEYLVVQDLDSSKLKMFAEIFRCSVGEAPDTCEYLITLKPPNACMILNAENTAWNAITDAYTPKLKCPIKKGKYVADKLTFDASKWSIFSLENWHFKLTYKLYEGTELTQGFIAQVHFNRIH